MTQLTALITSGRMPVSLEIARSLHRSGVRVVTLDSVSTYIAQSSRSVAKGYRVPSPARDFEGYRKGVLEVIQKEQVDILIPTTEDVFYLSRFADEFPSHCELFASSHDLLMKLHHKQNFIQFAAELGLGVPKSVAYTDAAQVSEFSQNDYMLKKVFSRAGSGVIFAKAGETPSHHNIPSNGSWLLQEKLKGQIFCSCTIVNHGQIVAHVVYEPAVANGTTSIVFKEQDQKAIRIWVESFAEKTGYHGTLSFDFFVDAEGVARAIECNPRPTSGFHVMDGEILASALMHRTLPKLEIVGQKRAQILFGTLLALPSILFKKNFMTKLREILSARDVIIDFRDPLPAFYQFPCSVAVLARSVLHGIPTTRCMMDGVEWDEEMPDQLHASTV